MINGSGASGKITNDPGPLAERWLPRPTSSPGEPLQQPPTDPDLPSAESAAGRRAARRADRAPPGPMVDLPVWGHGRSPCGTIDIEKALSGGVRALSRWRCQGEPRPAFNVDEVNLLDDHLVMCC